MSNYEKCIYRLPDNTTVPAIAVDGRPYIPAEEFRKLLAQLRKPPINRKKLEDVLTAYEQHDVLRLLASGVVDN